MTVIVAEIATSFGGQSKGCKLGLDMVTVDNLCMNVYFNL